jgi:hypothetical protein
MHVAQVVAEGFGIPLGRYPVDAYCAGLARVTVRLVQKVYIAQVGEGRKHPLGIVGGLRRKALELWCDGG